MFFKNIDFANLRSGPAPHPPKISQTDPTDTSYFDNFDATNPGSGALEAYVNGDRVDGTGPNPDHAFFEFTFRRFFDGSGHPYPIHRIEALTLSLPQTTKKQINSDSDTCHLHQLPSNNGLSNDTIATVTAALAPLSVTSSSTVSTVAISPSGIIVACTDGGNIVHNDDNLAQNELHATNAKGANCIKNYKKNSSNDDSNGGATTITSTSGNTNGLTTNNVSPGGTPVYV